MGHIFNGHEKLVKNIKEKISHSGLNAEEIPVVHGASVPELSMRLLEKQNLRLYLRSTEMESIFS